MLLEFVYVEHFSQNLILHINKPMTICRCSQIMNEIPLNTHSYYVTALETEVATVGLLSF